MTAQTTDVYSGNIRPEGSDEIDIRRYLIVLFKWWREILTLALLSGLLTGITMIWLNRQQPLRYAASADILIARLFSNIELDDRVETTFATNQADVNGWRTSLLQLSQSTLVADTVYAELQDELPATFETPEHLARVIEASIPLSADERFASNLIRITATTADPELSVIIANSWSRHLTDHINGLYGEVPETTIVSVSAERDAAFQAYQAAEKAYEEFLAGNQIDSLTRQIQEKLTLRDAMMANFNSMITSVVSTEFTAQLALYSALATAPENHAAALIGAQSNGSVASLSSLYSQRTSAIAQLDRARNMEATLVEGGEAAAKSNAAALQVLKLTALTSLQGGESIPTLMAYGTQQIQATEMTLEDQLTDVRALITVLDEYVVQLENDITQAAESTMVGGNLETVGGLASEGEPSSAPLPLTHNERVADAYAQLLSRGDASGVETDAIAATVGEAHEQSLAAVEHEIRTLQASIAAEEATQRELVHQRDLAWTTYDTVGNKLAELNLLRSSANTEVRVGNPAMVPFAPEPASSPLVPVVGMTMLAFFVAVVMALLADSFGHRPFFARRTT